MKVLMINGSPRKDSNTEIALKEIEAVLKENGIESKTVQVGNQAVRGCAACGGCKKLGKCVFDDVVNQLACDFEEADGLIVASPVYYASANGTLISVLDRLFHSTGFDKTMKVGASVVAARRGGLTASFDVLNKYFTISDMPVVSARYWNQLHGNNAEEAERDLEGLHTMRGLGKNMAFLIKCIRLGKEQLPPIERESKIYTNFIRKEN